MPNVYFGGDQARDWFGGISRGGATTQTHSREAAAKTGTIRIKEPLGPPSEENDRLWLNAQIPFENLADRPDVAERVLRFVVQTRRDVEDKTSPIRRRFRVINHMFRGNSVANIWALDEVHVPLVYVKVENAVPRLEEAVFGYDPWIRARGKKGKVSKIDAMRRTAFIDSQLADVHARELVQPSLRDLYTYQACCFKTFWRQRREWKVLKSVRHDTTASNDDYIIERKREKVVTFEGPDLSLIDPFDLIPDTRASGPQRRHGARFFGDNSRMTRGEIKDLCDRGIFQGWEEIKELKPGTGQFSTTFYDKLSRSVTERFTQGRQSPDGSPEEFDVTNIWGLFDLYGDGEEIECCLTVVEDQVVVQAIENWYDDGHRPYAHARAAKEGRDFYNVGPLDHAVKLNEELDQHRALGLESHKQSICPVVFAEDDSDLPDSLFGVEPGTVYRAVGKVTFGKIPDTLQSLPLIEGKLERNIEETTGVPSIYEGVDPGASGPTATHAMTLQANANKRMSGLLRSYGEMWQEIFRQFDAMNDQFLTKKVAFHVFGRAAKTLGEWNFISPKAYTEQLDFEVIGLQYLDTLGTRATGIAQYLTLAEPYRQEFPDVVNVPGVLRDFYDLTVGLRPGDEIVREPSLLSELLTQHEENDIMARGERVRVDPQDDDVKHLEEIYEYMATPAYADADPDVQRIFAEHTMNHEMQLERKEAREAAAANRSPEVSLGLGQSEQQAPDPMSAFGLSNDGAVTTPGENAGPPATGKAGKPGRNGPMFQTQNRIGMTG